MTAITIEFDTGQLRSYTDTYLAMLWHLAQANPADGFETSGPGELAQKIGWEIIRRWLAAAPAEMYNHQQGHYAHHQLAKFAVYFPGRQPGTEDFRKGAWLPRMLPSSREVQDALTARLEELGAFAGNMSRQEIARQLTKIVLPTADGAVTAEETL